MPELQRREPYHVQITNHFKRMILEGELRSGQPLPPMREIQQEWGVGLSVVQQAMANLRSEGLVHTDDRRGTFVNGHRVTLGPQGRMRASQPPAHERVEVRSAGLAPAPLYVAGRLGLLEVKPGFYPVIRREQRYFEDGDVPFMLSVSWCKPGWEQVVPELTRLSLLPAPGGAGKLIAERSGLEITKGHTWRKARLILDDGREGPLLNLEPGSACYAETYEWYSPEETLEYFEFITILDRVIESDMEP
jgi:GntR family transcriptional regulator